MSGGFLAYNEENFRAITTMICRYAIIRGSNDLAFTEDDWAALMQAAFGCSEGTRPEIDIRHVYHNIFGPYISREIALNKSRDALPEPKQTEVAEGL